MPRPLSSLSDQWTALIIAPTITATENFVNEREDLVDLSRTLLATFLLMSLFQSLDTVQRIHSLPQNVGFVVCRCRRPHTRRILPSPSSRGGGDDGPGLVLGAGLVVPPPVPGLVSVLGV